MCRSTEERVVVVLFIVGLRVRGGERRIDDWRIGQRLTLAVECVVVKRFSCIDHVEGRDSFLVALALTCVFLVRK